MPGPPHLSAEDGYDLVNVRARPRGAGRPRTEALVELEFDFQGEAVSLETARARRRALDRHGITAHIVPARYRGAGVTLAEARERAASLLGAPGSPGCGPAPLRLHTVHPMFYVFAAQGASESGAPAPAAPGVRDGRVTVDRCDGHLWTEEESDAYFRLVGPR